MSRRASGRPSEGAAERSLRRHRSQGQALVEFAVILPLFLLTVFGLLETGRLVYANSVLSQAAREGARVAAAEAAWIGVPGAGCVTDASAIGPLNIGAHVCPASVSDLREHVRAAANHMVAGIGAVEGVYLSCNRATADDPVPDGDWHDGEGGTGNGCQNGLGQALSSAGDVVSVRVDYRYEAFVPIISSILEPVEIGGSAAMVIH